MSEENKEKIKEEGLVSNNVQQHFDTDGIAERTTSRSIKIISKLAKVLAEEGIQFTFGRAFKTENHMGDNTKPPALYFTGEKVEINFVVPPMDKFGNEGKSFLRIEELKALTERVTKAGKEDLIIVEEPKEETTQNESNTKN